MGAGSSVISTELVQKLTKPSLDKFYAFHAECEAGNLTPMESYIALSEKYEELLKIDEVNSGVVNNNQNADVVGDLSVFSKPKLNSTNSLKSNVSEFTRFSREFALEKKQKEEEVLALELNRAMEELNELELLSISDPYAEEIVSRVFHVEAAGTKVKKIEKTKLKRSSSNPDLNEELRCALCSVYFDSRASMEVHLTHSELHSLNTALREKRLEQAHNEVIRLTGMAKDVIGQICSNVNGKFENSDKLSKSKRHWQAATRRVISDRITQKYIARLECRVDVPPGVKLLHKGSKYFYRTSSTYDIHMFLHTSCEIIEIVPHYVPYTHMIQARRITKISTSPSVDNGTTTTGEEKIYPCTRIYLHYGLMCRCVMGCMGSFISNLTFDVDPVYQHVQNNNNNSSSGHHRHGYGGGSLGGGKTLELLAENSNSFRYAEHQALITFIMNRLKIHHHHKQHHHHHHHHHKTKEAAAASEEDNNHISDVDHPCDQHHHHHHDRDDKDDDQSNISQLYFDMHKIMKSAQLTSVPKKITPVPVQVVTIAKIWSQKSDTTSNNDCNAAAVINDNG